MRRFLEQPMTIAFEKNFPEVILAITTIVYGLLLTLPPDSLQYAQAHTLMASYAPAWVWGVVFFLLGCTSFFAVLKRKGDIVRLSAKTLFFAWFFLAFLYLISAPAAPGWILMLCVSVLYGGVSSEYRTKTKWHDATDSLGPDM